MTKARVIAPYGSWRSPITAERIAAHSIGLSQVVLEDTDIYWIELRPNEAGRHVIVKWRDGTAKDILPLPYSARTRVHEYGGGAFVVANSVIYFSNDADQRLYRMTPGGIPTAITPETDKRYADGVIDHRRDRLICVEEDHSAGGEPINSIVAIDLEGRHEPFTLVSGGDFYASPRVSPDGSRLVWLTWNHPEMPWDSTKLQMANIAADGTLSNAHQVAGSDSESVFQPVFSPDNVLYFISDRSNWWNLYRYCDVIEAMVPRAAEFGLPQWIFGMSTYAFESPQRLVCAFKQDGIWVLATLDTQNRELNIIETPFTDIHAVTAGRGEAVFIAASPTTPPAVARLDLASYRHEILQSSFSDLPDSKYLSIARSICFPTPGREHAHAFYYAPVNYDFVAPEDEKPPLLVMSHGGPTASTSTALNLKIQYWTSRGFAVLDVNYRGSTGYGRDYRLKLVGQWGVIDVVDCLAATRFVVEQGWVEETRLFIRGGSAGGYTALCALTFHDLFCAGAAYYGVSDLEALAKNTHKFESHYLDRLIGPYPARRDLYRDRSPVHHADRLSRPMIFFQGMEDKVVPPEQTEKMVNVLRSKLLPVAYLAFPGESHGFRRAENIRRALEAEMVFYSRLSGILPADSVEPVLIENL